VVGWGGLVEIGGTVNLVDVVLWGRARTVIVFLYARHVGSTVRSCISSDTLDRVESTIDFNLPL
jgi:hypothetical protein